MKHLYLPIPLLAVTLLASTANAQTAKPRADKAARTVQTLLGPDAHTRPVMEHRGGGNDECATATMVTVTSDCSGSIALYAAPDATESLPAILCNGYTSPEARDLWFGFVATTTITSITVEGTLTFDAVIEGFSGTCGDLVSVGCADATFPPTTPVNTSETLSMGTDVGETYFVRVYSYWAPPPTEFDFTLCIVGVTEIAPNDQCTGADNQALAVDGTVSFTGDNTHAFDTEGLGMASVWHSFTTTECLNVVVDYCGTAPVFGNAFISLFSGCPYSSFAAAFSVDTVTCPDGNVTIYYSNLPAGTWYYAVMQDEANDAIGPYTINVSATALDPGYCEATAETCDEYIANLTVGNINNSSECADGPTVDYTDQSLDIYQDETLGITVTNGPAIYGLDAVGAWVDWNQDENFCQENEYVAFTSADAGQTFTGSVHAPADALVGTTRMRIRMTYNEDPKACGGADYGEVEDYSVNVLFTTGIEEFNPLAWSVFPNPSNGDMTIRFNASDAKVVIELFDVAGRAIHQSQRQLLNGQQVDLGLAGKLAHGAYTLRLSSPEGRSEQRVVVQ